MNIRRKWLLASAYGALVTLLAALASTLSTTSGSQLESWAIAGTLGAATFACMAYRDQPRVALPGLSAALVASLLLNGGPASIVLQVELLFLTTIHRRSPWRWMVWAITGASCVLITVGAAVKGDTPEMVMALTQNGAVVVVAIWWATDVRRTSERADRAHWRARRHQLESEHEREMSRTRAELAVTAERVRLARDMHDMVAGRLSAISLLAAHALQRDIHPDRRTLLVQDLKHCADATIVEVRAIIGDLANEQADPGSRVALSQRILETADAARALGVDLEITEPEEFEVDSALTVAYVVAQEAVFNMIAHAAPCRAGMTISASTESVSLHAWNTISAAPAGASLPPGDRGRGLANMRDRVAPFGGTVKQSTNAAGDMWKTTVLIPRPPSRGSIPRAGYASALG